MLKGPGLKSLRNIGHHNMNPPVLCLYSHYGVDWSQFRDIRIGDEGWVGAKETSTSQEGSAWISSHFMKQ